MRHQNLSSVTGLSGAGELNGSRSPDESAAVSPLQAGSQEDLLFSFLPATKRLARQVGSEFDCASEEADLVSAGLEGLLDAYPELSQVQPAKQKAFLRSRVYAAMIRTVRQLDHFSRAERRAIERLRRSQDVLEVRLGRAVEVEELALELGLREEMVRTLRARLDERRESALPMSPSQDMAEVASSGGIASEVLDPDGKDPLAVLLSAENTLLIEQALDRLPDREYDAVVATFYDGFTLKQVGSMLGVTEARASQLRTTGLRRMKKFLQRFQ